MSSFANELSPTWEDECSRCPSWSSAGQRLLSTLSLISNWFFSVTSRISLGSSEELIQNQRNVKYEHHVKTVKKIAIAA